MSRASARARPRRAMARVAVVADELDGWLERAGGADARAAAGRRPAELAREASGACVPVALSRAERGHEIHGGAVAVGVVAGLARGGDAQAVALQDPEDVVVDPGVDWLRGAAAGHRPGRKRAIRGGRREPDGRGEVGRSRRCVRAGPGRRNVGNRDEARGGARVVPGRAAVAGRARQHLVDVPTRVVVGEDRTAVVAGSAVPAQQVRGGGDRVGRVVAVLDAIVVAVDAVALPGRREELTRATGAGEVLARADARGVEAG